MFSLTLEAVAGLTLSLECGGCGSPVSGDGQCAFVGCHATAAILGRIFIKAFDRRDETIDKFQFKIKSMSVNL